MVGLVGAFAGHSDVGGLFLGQAGQFDADFFQVQAGDFLVQFLRETIDLGGVGVLVFPQIELG